MFLSAGASGCSLADPFASLFKFLPQASESNWSTLRNFICILESKRYQSVSTLSNAQSIVLQAIIVVCCTTPCMCACPLNAQDMPLCVSVAIFSVSPPHKVFLAQLRQQLRYKRFTHISSSQRENRKQQALRRIGDGPGCSVYDVWSH